MTRLPSLLAPLRSPELNRIWLAVPAALILVACGAPPPATAPEPEPELAEEELVVEEPDPLILSRELIDARVREPFGVQSSGRIPERASRSDVVVVDADIDGGQSSGPSLSLPDEDDLPATDADDTDADADPVDGDEPRDGGDTGDDEATGEGPRVDARAQRADADDEVADAALDMIDRALARRLAELRAGEEADEPAAADAAEERDAPARTHTVLPGETFFSIARRYEVTTTALAAANPGVVVDRIRSGQVLRLPAPGTAEQPPPERPAQSRTHRVRTGETIWSISRLYGVTPDRLRAANGMTDDALRVGQALVIPQ